MNRPFRRRKRCTSRSCALAATTSLTPCKVSMRKLPMSALRSRSTATRFSSRRR